MNNEEKRKLVQLCFEKQFEEELSGIEYDLSFEQEFYGSIG